MTVPAGALRRAMQRWQHPKEVERPTVPRSMKHRSHILAVLLAVLAAGGIVTAGELPGPRDLPPAEEPVPIEREARQTAEDLSCPELTDGCRICVQAPDGQKQCSFPGIACQPSGWRCQR